MSIAYEAMPRPDWASTTTIAIPHDAPGDPTVWARAIFSPKAAPLPVRLLFAAREVFARALRVPPGDPSMFDIDRVAGDEALIDTDDKHLRFVAAVRPDPAAGLLHVVTAVTFKGRVGRLYFVPVRLLHDAVTRSMATSAARRL